MDQEFPGHFLFELMFPLWVLGILVRISLFPMGKEWVWDVWKGVRLVDRLMVWMIDNSGILDL